MNGIANDRIRFPVLIVKVSRVRVPTLAGLFQGKRPVFPNVNSAMFKAVSKEKAAQGALDF